MQHPKRLAAAGAGTAARRRTASIHAAASRRIALRAAWLWLLLRAALALIRLAAKAPPLEEPSTKQAVIVIAVVGALSWLEIRRRNSDLFLANLGVAPLRLFLYGCIPPFLLEVVLRMLVAV
jgi:hypothetical protein